MRAKRFYRTLKSGLPSSFTAIYKLEVAHAFSSLSYLLWCYHIHSTICCTHKVDFTQRIEVSHWCYKQNTLAFTKDTHVISRFSHSPSPPSLPHSPPLYPPLPSLPLSPLSPPLSLSFSLTLTQFCSRVYLIDSGGEVLIVWKSTSIIWLFFSIQRFFYPKTCKQNNKASPVYQNMFDWWSICENMRMFFYCSFLNKCGHVSGWWFWPLQLLLFSSVTFISVVVLVVATDIIIAGVIFDAVEVVGLLTTEQGLHRLVSI